MEKNDFDSFFRLFAIVYQELLALKHALVPQDVSSDSDDPDDPDYVVQSQRLDKEDLLDDRIPF